MPKESSLLVRLMEDLRTGSARAVGMPAGPCHVARYARGHFYQLSAAAERHYREFLAAARRENLDSCALVGGRDQERGGAALLRAYS